MSGKYGADVEQLRDLARALDQAGQTLERHRMTVGNQIKISAWVGPVAVRFRLEWESDHSRRVLAAAHILTQNATLLRQNADEQALASAVDAGAGGAPGAGGSAAPLPQAPVSTADYIRNVSGMHVGEDGLRVQKVIGADGAPRYIVYIDGSGSTQGSRLSWGNNPDALNSLQTDTLSGIRAD
ncbi:hypothetical protein GY21_04275, partial [Cryobacterium roopkundense]